MVCPWITSFCSMSFCYNVDEKTKIDFWLDLLSAWSVHSLPGLHEFFLVLGFPPTSQRCARQMSWRVYSVPVCVSVGRRASCLRLCPALCPELQGQALATCDLELKQEGWKIIILLFLLFLKCMYSSHLFQSLILEVFGSLFRSLVRNISELNSCLCQLACGDIGFTICCFT